MLVFSVSGVDIYNLLLFRFIHPVARPVRRHARKHVIEASKRRRPLHPQPCARDLFIQPLTGEIDRSTPQVRFMAYCEIPDPHAVVAGHVDACMSFSDNAAGVWFRRQKQAGQAV
jgi:hypothetical protein